MKYLLLATLILGSLSVIAEEKTDVCNDVSSDKYCKGEYKKQGDICVDSKGNKVEFNTDGSVKKN